MLSQEVAVVGLGLDPLVAVGVPWGRVLAVELGFLQLVIVDIHRVQELSQFLRWRRDVRQLLRTVGPLFEWTLGAMVLSCSPGFVS